jgi:hypothetical protein
MATCPKTLLRKSADDSIPPNKKLVTFDEALAILSRDERFRATVYAMNTLLVQKGVYSPDEFEFQFRQWAQKAKKSV